VANAPPPSDGKGYHKLGHNTDQPFAGGAKRRDKEKSIAADDPQTISPLPPGFSQVFILKGVEVFCFDTLLQVLI
jgi:hypothetical protein